jgi:hypothetical protein
VRATTNLRASWSEPGERPKPGRRHVRTQDYNQKRKTDLVANRYTCRNRFNVGGGRLPCAFPLIRGMVYDTTFSKGQTNDTPLARFDEKVREIFPSLLLVLQFVHSFSVRHLFFKSSNLPHTIRPFGWMGLFSFFPRSRNHAGWL